MTFKLLLCSGLLLAGYLGGCASDQARQVSQAQTKFQDGLGHGSLNDREKMTASFKEAVELEPDNERYRVHLGVAYFLQGDTENAEKQYKQAYFGLVNNLLSYLNESF